MGRDVPFKKDAVCDDCGKIGAYDFYGDCLCQECSDKALTQDESMSDMKLQNESVENWKRVHNLTRTACVNYLKTKIPPELLERWKKQVANNVAIASDDIFFHMTAGMTIRNLLRDICLDDSLPPIQYSDGKCYRNWDDFYIGALHDLVTRKENGSEST